MKIALISRKRSVKKSVLSSSFPNSAAIYYRTSPIKRKPDISLKKPAEQAFSGERVLSISYLIMAAIFDFNGSQRLGREKSNLYQGVSRRSKIKGEVGMGK